jgi:hypothetical protein
MAKSHIRGHEIIYSFNLKKWIYKDDRTSIKNERPCKICNCYPTPEGYDACTGEIKNAKHACCGHGLEPAYAIY